MAKSVPWKSTELKYLQARVYKNKIVYRVQIRKNKIQVSVVLSRKLSNEIDYSSYVLGFTKAKITPKEFPFCMKKTKEEITNYIKNEFEFYCAIHEIEKIKYQCVKPYIYLIDPKK